MRWVYSFGGGEADGGRDDQAILGSIGAQLGEMSRIGLNVPPGFTVTTEACRVFLRTGEPPSGLWKEIQEAMRMLTVRTGRAFGDDRAEPLLVSVGRGSAVSMPGTMDTILDVGSTEDSIRALGRAAGERFALDCHRRFVQLYGQVVLGVGGAVFERALAEARRSSRVAHDAELDLSSLRTLVTRFRGCVREASGRDIPADPWAQLREAVLAVFGSWDTRRARDDRRVRGIRTDLGTAVNVMAMVYGNRGDDSASGVAFTRDPSSGEARLFGEFLSNEQREDGVAGVRDPKPIVELQGRFGVALGELEQVRRLLESHYRDMQDLDFIVERGELYILQTRAGERSARAAVKIAVDMADEGLIDRRTALLRIDPERIEEVLHSSVDPSAGVEELAASPPELGRLLGWADDVRTLAVRANADGPAEAARARELGAEGIGLCRTEHMLVGEDRLGVVRELIVARSDRDRARALELLSPMQRADFEGIFRAMAGLPVAIRMLDSPLHELLPTDRDGIRELAERTGRDPLELTTAILRMRESNPMPGRRGARVGICFPEVTAMQARALFQAALAVTAEGLVVHPEIVIPFVRSAQELETQRRVVERVARDVFEQAGRGIPYALGAMIEVPRAALTARQIARHADFFSIGTDDLTRTTLGLSRDDLGTFLPLYLEQGILKDDPFRSLDVQGVGRLVSMATVEGRKGNPRLLVGVCGEHGGDPVSMAFFHDAGVDHVSCAPFRVPTARLAAAQSAIRSGLPPSPVAVSPRRERQGAPAARVAVRA